jgi:hypothetical protein
MKKVILLAVILICIGMAHGSPAFDQNKALRNAGQMDHPGVMELSGTSPDIFNYAEFQKAPLNPRGLEEWYSGMQGYDYEDIIWSIRDFLTYEAPL